MSYLLHHAWAGARNLSAEAIDGARTQVAIKKLLIDWCLWSIMHLSCHAIRDRVGQQPSAGVIDDSIRHRAAPGNRERKPRMKIKRFVFAVLALATTLSSFAISNANAVTPEQLAPAAKACKC
jgi:hypothetical protein